MPKAPPRGRKTTVPAHALSAADFLTPVELEAWRLYQAYGHHRACQLAGIFSSRPFQRLEKTLYQRVHYVLSQMRAEAVSLAPSPGYTYALEEKRRLKSTGALTVTVDGQRLTLAAFRRHAKDAETSAVQLTETRSNKPTRVKAKSGR